MEEPDRGVDHRVCGRGRRVGVPQSAVSGGTSDSYRPVGSYYLSSNTIDYICTVTVQEEQ